MKAPPIIHDKCTSGPMETKHFLGEVPSMDDLPDWITEEEEKKLKAHKTRGKVGVAIKKKDALFHAGVTTDRAWNLMVASSHLQIEGTFNYRTKWIHDVLCQKMWNFITEHDGFFAEGLIPPKDLEEIGKQIQKLQADLPPILFTDKEFREITGLKHLSGEDIRGLVRNYNQLKINGWINLYHDPETGKFKRLLFDEFPIGGVLIQKTGNYSRRNQKPEYKYLIVINFYGLIVLHNLSSGSFTKLPQRLYKLRRASQEKR